MTLQDVVFLFDVDNTLVDNDRVQDDLRKHLSRICIKRPTCSSDLRFDLWHRWICVAGSVVVAGLRRGGDYKGSRGSMHNQNIRTS